MGLFSLVKLISLFFIYNYVYGQSEQNFPASQIVSTLYGPIQGFLAASGSYYEFCGIRYAMARQRYQAPEGPPSFKELYVADIRTVLCPQFPTNDPLAAPSETEDCLILNIYLPAVVNTTMPVMVFLHGGDFGVGGSSPLFYGPEFLIGHGVVVVTVNYRLNAFGFLNLGLKEAPGNAGLKDIRSALRWIKDNIGFFSGDKDNVTVFGHGSGGAAAIYLTLSKSCEGLFKRIISESGTMFSPKSFDPDPLETASQVAKALGINTKDKEALLKLYLDVPASQLEEAIGVQMHARSVFLPSVETYIDENDEPFLTDTPFNILESETFNAVPAIFGLNTVEGLSSTLDYNTISSQMNRIKNDDFSCIDQRNLKVSNEEKIEIRNVFKDTYFTNITAEEEVLGGLVNFYSDFCYTGPMALFTEMYFNHSNVEVYQYIFNHIGNRNLGRLLTNSTLSATTYMDELFYIFDLERLTLPLDAPDGRIINFMTLLWTDFAKFGKISNPEIGEWHPYPNNLAISLEPQYVAPLTPERASFWRALYENYGAEIKPKMLENN